MSGIDPASIPNRRTSSPEVSVTRVARSEDAHEEAFTPQPLPPGQHRPEAGGDPSLGRRSHSDPAVSLSASLAKLDLGTMLKATVIGFDTSNQPIIKTDQGTFILNVNDISPPLDLKIDTQLELKIVAVDHVIEAQLITKNNVSLSPQPLLNLTLVGVGGAGDGKAPIPQNSATPGEAQPGPPLQYVPQPAQTAMLSAMAKLPPVTLPPSSFMDLRDARGAPSPQEAPPSAAPALPPALPGKDLSVLPKTSGIPAFLAELETVLRPMIDPAGNVEPNRQASLTGLVLAASVVSATRAESPAPGASQAPRLLVGQDVLVKIIDATLQKSDPNAAPAPLSAPLSDPVSDRNLRVYPASTSTGQASGWRMAGEVIATENTEKPTAGGMPPPAPAGSPSAQTIQISTPVGVLRLVAPVNLPLGSHLVIEISQTKTPAAPVQQAALPSAPVQASQPLTSFLSKWSAIDNIIAALTKIDPALAAEVRARLASPLGSLGDTALHMAKAMSQSSGVEQWLGFMARETLARSGHQSLIDALKDDLSRIAQSTKDTSPTDWRTLLLPIHDGHETQALPVLIRSFENETRQDDKSGNKDGATKKERVTRFVIDVSLSRMGFVQMDGMIKAKSFSLIMRTEQVMGSAMRTKIRDIFSAALARNQFEGDLVFQPGKPFPLSASAFLGGDGNSPGGPQSNIPGNIYV